MQVRGGVGGPGWGEWVTVSRREAEFGEDKAQPDRELGTQRWTPRLGMW